MHYNTIIIGAGPAGLGASYRCQLEGIEHVVLESKQTWGGLTAPINMGEFIFDRFVHLSFTKIETIKERIHQSNMLHHQGRPVSIYGDEIYNHPIESSLYNLPEDLKRALLEDIKHRKRYNNPSNFFQLKANQYGPLHNDEFTWKYHNKYWVVNPSELEVNWTNGRFYVPSIKEYRENILNPVVENKYYAPDMYYPAKKGGFRETYRFAYKKEHFRFDSRVIEINPKDKILKCSNGVVYTYDRLISSIPLNRMYSIVINCDPEIEKFSKGLINTKGILISVVLNGCHDLPLWWYIYDETNLAARCYTSSKKNHLNAPSGYTTFQIEYYCLDFNDKIDFEDIIVESLRPFKICKSDVSEYRVDYEEYANIIPLSKSEETLKSIRDYYQKLDIALAGRFGLWKYLWSDESFLSGYEAV